MASIPGTVVVYGPVYQRSGFGMLARVWTLSLRDAGLRVKVVPVDCDDQSQASGWDDCDMHLLRSLEYTPLVPPITAIFAYQPTYVWPKMWLPEPHVRIMLTTFDSSAAAASPPHRQIFICNQLDQTWLANATEAAAWVQVGMDPTRIKAFNWPHDWIENPRLPVPQPPIRDKGRRFRFLHVSCYLPRRRLDVLLRAFFEEFQDDQTAELYLKMSFPGWHPVRGKPRRDFFAMIENLRRKTGSRAPVVVDEMLGTRLELVRLNDSCDAYVSPDTTMTAPVAEALIRKRPAIITDGWGVELPEKEMIVVPNSPEMIPLTPEMAEYMPHQRGKTFQALDVLAMRQALRKAFTMPAAEVKARTEAAYEFMRATYSLEATRPPALAALEEVWELKRKTAAVAPIEISTPAAPAPASPKRATHTFYWGGLQLFHGKVPTANREICLELLARGHSLSLVPGNGPFQIEELELKSNPDFERLASHFYVPLLDQAEFGISCRWHPGFQEGRAKRYVLYNTWWSGAIPAEWPRPIAEQVEEVWVPSEHVRQNFLLGGVAPEKLQVIPFGINPRVFQRQSEPFPLKTRKSFRFLFVGETSQRKGFDTLLRAYAQAFTAKDEVCLVVKDLNCEDYYGKLLGRQLVAEFARRAGFPEIEYLDGMLDAPAMARLYSSCQCFVQPFRAASNGQSLLEAMTCGVPVIATRYGGALDFCSDETALLLDAREIRHQTSHVGHWRVEGPQRYAEIQLPQLIEQMRQVYRGSTQIVDRARRAEAYMKTHLTWARTVDKIEERLQAVGQLPARDLTAGTRKSSSPSCQTPQSTAATGSAAAQAAVPGTILLFAPFRNRSGYGVAARALAVMLHHANVSLRCVNVDSEEAGIDDCDAALLRQLENTPVIAPVTAVFFHVPSPNWQKVGLPPGSKRILYTTFDSSAQGNTPPPDWIRICNAMDQLWLMSPREADVFIQGGVDAKKVRVLPCPHHWVENSVFPLPQPAAAVCADSGRFRFLSIAMLQPRRRWDALIEAFLSEFTGDDPVELYLKVNFPSWHPVPGQPKRDLAEMIERLRAKTGSQARIIVDDALGTRRQICDVLDSCQIYVSTDTCVTAPVGEAFVRMRPVILPDGLGFKLPLCSSSYVVPVDPAFQRPITEAELQYQPHHRGSKMPLLHVEDIRQALRASYETKLDQRQNMGAAAAQFFECNYGGAVVGPGFIKALRELWLNAPAPGQSHPQPAAAVALPSVAWHGSFLDHGSLSHVNRELVRALKTFPGAQIQCVAGGGPAAADAATHWPDFANKMATSADASVTVRHAWPPNWKRPAHGKLVVIQPWEFGLLPMDWVNASRAVDEFWLPSEYVRQVYIASGVPADKVVVVPNGVDPVKFHPQVAPAKLATQKKFKFLFVGGTIGRKGPDLLLQAYLKQFTAADDVCLVIKDFGGKSVYQGQTFEAQIRATQAAPNAPEILYLNQDLAPESLPGLYTACDCLVLPYRGEGYGLPVVEAMACGLPVVVTAGGATDDFVRGEFAYRIPATRRTIGHEVSGMKLAGEGWMLEPNLAALGESLRHVFDHPAEARERGQLASRHAHQYCTWQHSAAIAAQRLRQLAPAPRMAAKPVAKPQPVKLPEVAHVGRLDETRQLLGQKNFEAAWKAAQTAIARRPFHPEAFLLLAEIALAAGAGKSARLCAQHARELAPGWQAPKQFLAKPLKGDAKLEWLDASRITHSASPRLSVCLIVKNEEKFLAQCLKSVRDFASQIIVVDTGSKDRTVEIAREFGAEIHSFAWCDDFSAARNAALEHATGDWVLMLDADEELPAAQHAKLVADMKAGSNIAFRLPLVNAGKEIEGRSFIPRLFRNAPEVYYHGRIHEQVFNSLLAHAKKWGLKTGLGTAEILHHGYTQEMVRDRNKVERNLKLLRAAVAEDPTDANLLMNLGLELVRSDDVPAGIEQYRAAFEMMSAQPAEDVVPELREVLLTQFTSHLYKIHGHEEVVQVLNSPLAKRGGLTASLHLALGLAHFELKQFREAADQMRLCLSKRQQPCLTPINTDVHSAAPQHCLALCLAKLGDAAGAEKAFTAALAETAHAERARLDYAKFLQDGNRPVDALQRLHELVTASPRQFAAWKLGGEIALSKQEFLEFALDWTGEAFKALPENPVIASQRAEALMLNQNPAGALELWEKIWRSEPEPRPLAAMILCATACAKPAPTPNLADERATSLAFIEWYRKLLTMGANALAGKINERLEGLSQTLPSAAQMIEAAFSEVNMVG